jgi:hypothetical protein
MVCGSTKMDSTTTSIKLLNHALIFAQGLISLRTILFVEVVLLMEEVLMHSTSTLSQDAMRQNILYLQLWLIFNHGRRFGWIKSTWVIQVSLARLQLDNVEDRMNMFHVE